MKKYITLLFFFAYTHLHGQPFNNEVAEIIANNIEFFNDKPEEAIIDLIKENLAKNRFERNLKNFDKQTGKIKKGKIDVSFCYELHSLLTILEADEENKNIKNLEQILKDKKNSLISTALDILCKKITTRCSTQDKKNNIYTKNALEHIFNHNFIAAKNNIQSLQNKGLIKRLNTLYKKEHELSFASKLNSYWCEQEKILDEFERGADKEGTISSLKKIAVAVKNLLEQKPRGQEETELQKLIPKYLENLKKGIEKIENYNESGKSKNSTTIGELLEKEWSTSSKKNVFMLKRGDF